MTTSTTTLRLHRAGGRVFLTLALGLLWALPGAAQININDATAEELQELDGIGAKRAQDIIEDRERNGKFTAVEDLARVSGVSSRLVEKIMDDVTTGGGNSAVGGIKLKAGDKVPKKVVQQVLAAFDDEPSIREVQLAAIDYARAEPSNVDSMLVRARTSAILPQFRVRPWVSVDRDVRTRTNLDATEAVVETKDDDNSFRFQAQATWELDQLIFNKEEARIWREGVRITNLRDRVVNEVTRRYYERRRLQIDLELSPPTDVGDRIRKELRIQELTADIDAITGGWFSAELEAVGKEPY